MSFEGIKAFFGFAPSQADFEARKRVLDYLSSTLDDIKLTNQSPKFKDRLQELYESTKTEIEEEEKSGNPPSAADVAKFWSLWDDIKEELLNYTTNLPMYNNIIPDGDYVAMWRFLENGRYPSSTAPPEELKRRKSSITGRVRYA